MDNRIRQIWVVQGQLEPTEAEVWISVYPDQVTATTTVRGRLVGPRCRYASTVEVAYPLREYVRPHEKEGEPHLSRRVLIPEPSFWDPVSPFLYGGAVELWQGTKLCDQVQLQHGLRTVRLGKRGLLWNGRPLALRGAVPHEGAEAELLALHQAGYNALLAPVGADELWDRADHFGFLMLGRIAHFPYPRTPADPRHHPSSLGWILPDRILQDPLVKDVGHLPIPASSDHPVGIELSAVPSAPLPPGIQFVLCREDLLPALAEIALPKLVLTKREVPAGTPPPGILGWITD
jgi:hypothetical protein